MSLLQMSLQLLNHDYNGRTLTVIGNLKKTSPYWFQSAKNNKEGEQYLETWKGKGFKQLDKQKMSKGKFDTPKLFISLKMLLMINIL